MATELQRELATEIIKDRMKPAYKRRNKKELLVTAGYDETTALATPGRVIEQKGVQEAIKEIATEQGLTEDFIKRALIDDIEGKPRRRARELELGASILGMTEHDKKGGDKTLIVIIAGQSANRYGVHTAQEPGRSGERPPQI